MTGSDTTVTIRDDATEAEFAPAANMVCVSLRVDGAELLDPTHGLDAYAEQGKTMGIPLLHPWANRLSGREYEVLGRHVTLPQPEGRYPLDPNGLPIHGAMPGDLRWECEQVGPNRLHARLRYSGGRLLELFPFEHELHYDAAVSGRELSIEVTLHAPADGAVPVSFGFHPYLTLPGSDRRDWQVQLGGSKRLRLDPRMIPTGDAEPLAARRFVLDDESWDDGLAALDDRPEFSFGVAGRGVVVRFEQGFRYAQVYAPPAHQFICLEPMTAPTDALTSGQGLSIVEPGGSYRTRFTVAYDEGTRWT